ncbi:DNA primase [Marinimicrobium sp. ARAG 43.8]|uniref:DNA primase n=1 Tax=Marinimicrobium sp. ARAG 43.8 TaxID=3418719 RepID=UPI003CF67939
MAGLIPQSFIDELLDRVDLVEIVDHRVKLRKSGKNYSACCPFHDEKTPSFTVSPDKQFYYCFGCGASGNAVGFLMDYERLGFPEAVEQLAHHCGLDVPREEQTQAQRERAEARKSIYSLLEQADRFYRLQLRQHPERMEAVNYLKRRGLDGHIARDYGIGFAPPGWDNLLKSLGTGEEERHLLIEGGMLIDQPEQKKRYDRFRHRIMFPIRDLRGRVIGFGGRVLGDDKPKYLNSPETPVFHKGRELYGLHEARKAHRELPRLLVVEGYMDVVALAQFGIRYGVATLGTACGEDHLRLAFKHTREVVFCFDGDQAGRTAAERALAAALPVMEDGRQVKFLFLPDGEDPDTLVRQAGPEKFINMVNMAVPLEDYLFDALSRDLNPSTLEGRALLSKRAAPLLDQLPRGVFRELMFDRLAQRTGLNRNTLMELVTEPLVFQQEQANARREQATTAARSHPPQDRYDEPPPGFMEAPPEYLDEPDGPPPYPTDGPDREGSPQRAAPSRYRMPPARKAIGLLLANPALAAEEAPEAWLAMDEPALATLGQLLKLLRERPHYGMANIIGYWRAEHGPADAEQLAAIAGQDLLVAAGALGAERAVKPARADYDTRAAFDDCLAGIRRQLAERQKSAALDNIRQKSADFAGMSREERETLLKAALAHKTPR